MEDDPVLYLYTSLTAGSSHIITATSRMETILKANRIPFSAIDIATDEKARKLWGRRSRGKKLPGLVKGGEILGDLDQIEEWNEYGELKQNIGTVPNVGGPGITPPSKFASNLPRAPKDFSVGLAKPARPTSSLAPSKPPTPRTQSSIQIQEPDKEKTRSETTPDPSFAMRQLGAEAAKIGDEKNKEKVAAARAAHAAALPTELKGPSPPVSPPTVSASDDVVKPESVATPAEGVTPTLTEEQQKLVDTEKQNRASLTAAKADHDARLLKDDVVDSVPPKTEEEIVDIDKKNKEKILQAKAEHDALLPKDVGADSTSSKQQDETVDIDKKNKETLLEAKAEHDALLPEDDGATPNLSEGQEEGLAQERKTREKLTAARAAHDAGIPSELKPDETIPATSEGESPEPKTLSNAAVISPPAGAESPEGVASPPLDQDKSALSIPPPSTAVSSTSSLGAEEAGDHHRAESLHTASQEEIAKVESATAIKEERTKEEALDVGAADKANE